MAQPEATGQARRKEDQPHEEQHHASVGFYWMIGGILAAVTGLEVAIFYIPGLGGVMGPLLIALSAGKFLLVVMFFMHLKFDSRIYTGLFIAGISLAIFMVSALVILYHYLPRFRV